MATETLTRWTFIRGHPIFTKFLPTVATRLPRLTRCIIHIRTYCTGGVFSRGSNSYFVFGRALDLSECDIGGVCAWITSIVIFYVFGRCLFLVVVEHRFAKHPAKEWFGAHWTEMFALAFVPILQCTQEIQVWSHR